MTKSIWTASYTTGNAISLNIIAVAFSEKEESNKLNGLLKKGPRLDCFYEV